MFLAGMIIGVTLGVLLIRLHKLLNEMDSIHITRGSCDIQRRVRKKFYFAVKPK